MPENAPTTPTAPTLNEQEKKSDRIYRFIISALCFAMCTVQIVNVIYPFFISSEFFVIHFMFGMLMCYLVYDYKGKKRYFYSPAKIFDIILALGVAAVAIYILRDIDAFLLRMDLVASPTDIVMGAICTVIVLEGCRRLTGPSLPAIALITILYALFGKYLPGLIGHKGYSFTRVIKTIFSQQGIFGMPIGVSANTVFLFLLFGAFLNVCGADLIFRDLSTALAGRKRGGPAKIAIIASAIFGTISGSSVANVVSTGTFTIPMMKRCGYRPVFAGAVEAVASTGGQIMPPIMGAAAFLMAEYIGIPYAQVAVKAILPAILYFTGIFISVHLEAKKLGLNGIPRDQLPKWRLLARDCYLILPLILLVWLVSSGAKTMSHSAAYSILAAIAVGLVNFFMLRLQSAQTRTFRTVGKAALGAAGDSANSVFDSLEAGAKGAITVAVACAMAGIIAGCITVTGLASILINAVVQLAGNATFIGLILTMICCIILGMGVPTTANYCIMASTCAPILIKMGYPLVAAHFFVFYFGIVADITPPVALAAYAGSAIAKSNPMKTGINATKLAIAAFIVPFIFAYNPQMLFENVTSVFQVIQIVITALLGIFAVAAGLEGYILRPMHWPLRVLAVIGGLTLLIPGTVSDLIGLVIVAGIIALQVIQNKKAARETA